MTQSTNFVSGTLITSNWLNEVDSAVYDGTTAYTPAGTGAVVTTVQTKLRESVSVLDFGASTTETAANNTIYIQNALNTGKSVELGYGTYAISGTLKFTATGQKFIGKGQGEISGGVFYGQTCLKYTGAAGGKMVSAFDGVQHWSDCTLADMTLWGNGLARIGLEMYNDSVAGGAWRQKLERVTIYNCSNTTGGISYGIYGGSGTGNNNMNDFNIFNCFILYSAIGLNTGGAIGNLSGHTTIGFCSTAGIWVTQGGAINLGDSTLTTNTLDIRGVQPQSISLTGGWCENSTAGIYQGSTAHNVAFTGCILHTSCATHMMDFGSSAGYHSLAGNYLPATTSSTTIKNVNPTDATGLISGQGITLTYVTSGYPAPQYMPAKMSGNAATWRTYGVIGNGATLALSLGRGTFFVAVLSRDSVGSARTSATYSAFLFDGDSEAVTSIASDNGSNGAWSFSLAPSNNAITLTNTSGGNAYVSISATGTIE